MMNKQKLCPEHASPVTIYCSNCQRLICILCITEHSSKSHQLMSPLDFARSVLKPQICEQLAALHEKEQKFSAPDPVKLASSMAFLTKFASSLLDEATKLKSSADSLQLHASASASGKRSPAEDLERAMKGLLEKIESLGKPQQEQIETAVKIDGEYQELVKRMGELPGSQVGMAELFAKFPEQVQQLKGLSNTIQEIRATVDGLDNQYKKLDPVIYTAKFSQELFGQGSFLWRLDKDGRQCSKELDNATITICCLDQRLEAGWDYEIEYLVDGCVGADPYDAIGIATSEKVAACSFYKEESYGLFNSKIHAHLANHDVEHKFMPGEVVRLAYSGKKWTLDFYVDGNKLSETLMVEHMPVYYSGVAFRGCGSAVTLLSFSKS